ncbi:AraC family transcriptional regulator [Actinoplanes sp. NPDC023714]|uniref:AraC family transcriptional regulator n=1 Tax=Actinoplanes sp. NPDC023714 TaxID=3154322 RepID=UPI0033CAC8D4
MIHSLPLVPAGPPCASVTGRPHPSLRGLIAGYSGFFRDGPVAHRVLPLNAAVIVVDIAGAGRVVSGCAPAFGVLREVVWGYGVSAGLTPAGVSALLGLPMSALAGSTVPLDAVLGAGDELLAARLAAAGSWAGRFTILDEWFGARLSPDATAGTLVNAAWHVLQRGHPVGDVAADLGVSRRRLERDFRRDVGLTPGTVARTTRFQRAVRMLAAGEAPARVAIDAGYADQPHLCREIRARSGLTPAALRAALTHSFKTPEPAAP